MAWEHRDFSHASVRGAVAAELEPLGSNAGTFSFVPPPAPQKWPQEYRTYPGFSAFDLLFGECVVDGISTPCGMVSGENSVQCPDNDCGPRAARNSNGHVVAIVIFDANAFLDNRGVGGYAGFIPAGATYTGSGRLVGGGINYPDGLPTGRETHGYDFISYGQNSQNPDIGGEPRTGHLEFDGCNLTYYDQSGKGSRRWEAWSGLPGTKPEDQNKYKIGPIPDGIYSVDPSDTSYRWDKYLIENPSPVGPPVVAIPKHPIWASKERQGQVWGDYRTPIVPVNVKMPEGRDGNFFIHGGTIPGSAGCIDLIGGCDDFHRWFIKNGNKLPLVVKLTCNPWDNQ